MIGDEVFFFDSTVSLYQLPNDCQMTLLSLVFRKIEDLQFSIEEASIDRSDSEVCMMQCC